MRFYLFVLATFLLPSFAYAGALTTIKENGKQYNLYIFDKNQNSEAIKAFNDALQIRNMRKK